MTKIIICLLSALIFTLSFSGCSESEPKERYNIQLCSFSDCLPEAMHQLEYDKWSRDVYTDDSVEKKITVSLDGRSIEAEYDYSTYWHYDFYPTHVYRDADRNRYAYTEDGNLNGFLCLCDQDEVKDTDEIYTEEECRDIATTFLSRYVNAENYTIDTNYDADSRSYSFAFKRYVNGLQSAEEAELRVAENGHLHYMCIFMLDKMSSEARVDFDFEEIEAQITARLDEAYAKVKETYDRVEYDFEGYTLTMDENGKYMLVCDVDVDCFIDSESGSVRSGGMLQFVIKENNNVQRQP
ncbi:MAG: hypothetical protein E7661_00285 [Ruminococcaceae bacterium]|nr:hypothetical protein [Oscillospiraceae bacterium]